MHALKEVTSGALAARALGTAGRITSAPTTRTTTPPFDLERRHGAASMRRTLARANVVGQTT